MSAPLLSKYLRLRREWQSADLTSSHRQRLAHELAEIECAFVEMGFMPFADTQPFEQFKLDAEDSTADGSSGGMAMALTAPQGRTET